MGSLSELMQSLYVQPQTGAVLTLTCDVAGIANKAWASLPVCALLSLMRKQRPSGCVGRSDVVPWIPEYLRVDGEV